MKVKFFLPVIKIYDSKNDKFYVHISEYNYETYDEASEGLDILIRQWTSFPYYNVIVSKVKTRYVEL